MYSVARFHLIRKQVQQSKCSLFFFIFRFYFGKDFPPAYLILSNKDGWYEDVYNKEVKYKLKRKGLVVGNGSRQEGKNAVSALWLIRRGYTIAHGGGS